MGIVNIDNEYIDEFINCKKNNSDITNFNLSVGIVRGFWRLYEEDKYYGITDYSTMKLKDVAKTSTTMNMIIESAHKNGEPGLLFLDVINDFNEAEEEIVSTNPCSELTLLPYESCNIGSLNLVKIVEKDANGNWSINYQKLGRLVYDAIRFLDNVIDVNKYPLPEIEEKTKMYRKIGLGVMGWADTLYLMNIPYNSQEALNLASQLSSFILTNARKASELIAKEKGSFPAIDKTKHKGKVLRNISTTTIAPTGTLSMIASVSSGIEPLFAIAYTKTVMDNDQLSYVHPLFKEKFLLKTGLLESSENYKYIMTKISNNGTIQDIPEIPYNMRQVFVTTHDISIDYHVLHQAAWQENIESSISKTINMSHDAKPSDVEKAYKMARRHGCKGITVYRDGSREDQVLTTGKSYKTENIDKAAEEFSISSVTYNTLDTCHVLNSYESDSSAFVKNNLLDLETTKKVEYIKTGDNLFDKYRLEECVTHSETKRELIPRKRPDITTGFTEKVKIGCGNLYVTVNYDDEGICEVFTNTGKAGGCPSQSEATARLVSLALRAGVSVTDIVQQLKGIRCPSTIRQKGLKVTSCPDAIGRLVERVYLGQITPAKISVTETEELIEAVYEGPQCENNCSKCSMVEFCNNPDKTVSVHTIDKSVIESEKHGEDLGKLTKYCPECNTIVEHEGGCVICKNCGWSKCG